MCRAATLAGPMAGALALALSFGSAAQPVLQRGYDAGVSGANLAETTLNTSNVAPTTFGLVFTLPVDDNVLAQPLYVPNVAIPLQGIHNVVYVATMSDTLYAFDAHAGAPLWSVNFANLVGAMPVPIANWVFGGNRNIIGNLGILSTPVIDPSTNIMYLVACTLENNTLAYRLHAVDITTGMEPHGPGVLISGSYGGATFQPRYQLQRASLVLSGKQVVFGFSAVELESPNTYAGWVMAYDKATLQQSGAFATVSTGDQGGGVWQSGRPPVVDSSGYVYVFTGNGYSNGYDGINNFSESALKLDPANGLKLLDWFTPGNWSILDALDFDLSSSGPLLIPGTSPSLLAGGGKTGDLYVLNTANLGKFNAADSQVVQKENIAGGGEFRGGPVYWQRSAANGGPLLYDWGAGDSVKAYPFNGTTFAASPSSRGISAIWPGGILALSANGEQPGSGVLWATLASSGDAENNPPVAGELHAFDAANVSNELWNSTINASRDAFGNFAKFVPPLVANGKVYMATWSNQVAVYGLLTYRVSPTLLAFGAETTNVASAPMAVTVTNTDTVALPVTSIALSGADASQFSQTNSCGTSVAVGSNCTISVVFTPTSGGSKAATLKVNGGGGAGTQTVALSGVGVVLTYSVSPTSLAFGSEITNVASAPMVVTVTNTGAAELPVTSIALSGTDASQLSQTNSCGTSVAVGSNCTISAVFTPTSGGSKTATLNVNAGVTPTLVPLSGGGIWPAVSATVTASPTTLSPGSPVMITWTSTNATGCTGLGGGANDGWANSSRPAAGSVAITEPGAVAAGQSETLTFIIACTSSASKLSAHSSVSVVQLGPTVTVTVRSGGGALDSLSLVFLFSILALPRLRRRGGATLGARSWIRCTPTPCSRAWRASPAPSPPARLGSSPNCDSSRAASLTAKGSNAE